MLSIIIWNNVLSFIDFEASFVMSFNDKVSKNAPKHEIVWLISNRFRFSCFFQLFQAPYCTSSRIVRPLGKNEPWKTRTNRCSTVFHVQMSDHCEIAPSLSWPRLENPIATFWLHVKCANQVLLSIVEWLFFVSFFPGFTYIMKVSGN